MFLLILLITATLAVCRSSPIEEKVKFQNVNYLAKKNIAFEIFS